MFFLRGDIIDFSLHMGVLMYICSEKQNMCRQWPTHARIINKCEIQQNIHCKYFFLQGLVYDSLWNMYIKSLMCLGIMLTCMEDTTDELVSKD